MFKKKLVNLLIIGSLISGSMVSATMEAEPFYHQDMIHTEVQVNVDIVEIVKVILSKYEFTNLTVEEAKEINEAFRGAGIKGGRELTEAIKEAGYDPEVIKMLDPPPMPQKNEEQKPNNKPENKHSDENKQKPNNDKVQKPENNNEQNTDENNQQNSNNDAEQKQGQQYSVEQAISDNAQLHTIAFDALAFFTGELGSDSFFPPGKVSDFFGFQYLRDVDEGGLGHNTTFVPRCANNVLSILTDEQIEELKILAVEQEELLKQYGYDRFPLMQAFRRLLENDIPNDAESLSLEAVTDYSSELYEIDGLLSYNRAKVLGKIINSLTDEQRAHLDEMKEGNSLTWPDIEDQVDKTGMSHEQHVLIMTYASEMFSWYAGDIESDTYFCPERHGTYFGAFYMKDMPAMGNPDYTISTQITGDSGKEFLTILTSEQQKLITDLVDIQRDELLEIVEVRRAIAKLLREFMSGEQVDIDKVLELSKKYGELDGEIVHNYATNFAKVYKTLTEDQKEQLYKLRNLDGYEVEGAFLFSAPIDMPNIIDTDFFFK